MPYDQASFLAGLAVGRAMWRPPTQGGYLDTGLGWTADPEWLRYDSGIIATADHSTRTPYTKVADGWAVIVYNYNSNAGEWGGNWCNMTVISTNQHAAHMVNADPGSIHGQKSYLGLTWYYYASGQNETFGGASELNTIYPSIDWKGAAAFNINGNSIPTATFKRMMQAANVRLISS